MLRSRLFRHSASVPRLFKCLSSASESASNMVRIEILKEKRVFLIEITRPEVRNAIDPPTARALHKAFKQFDADKDTNVAVIHGSGGHFSAGFDLKAFSASKGQGDLELDMPGVSDLGPIGPTRLTVSKPVIAAISGYAVAGGMELALLCDLRVVDESAIMGIFCRRFGIPLIDGGTIRLPRLIGLSRAMDLILTGRAVDAQEALHIGLANRLVNTGRALEAAIDLAEEIGRFPQRCMRADRMSALYSVYEAKNLQDALTYECVNGIKVVQEESVPGATSFAGGAGRHGQTVHGKTDPPSKL